MSAIPSKQRKACQPCTKAKAKCSPSESGPDICYRCQRLGKECVFDKTVRKRGPKNRSRVKQLEHRLDTLIDLISNGQEGAISQGTVDGTGSGIAAALQNAHLPLATPPESASGYDGHSEVTQTDTDSPENATDPTVDAVTERSYLRYDPVEAGLLDDATAETLLQEYRDLYTSAFPFVAIPPSVNSKALRQSQPFLFLAVVSVTTHKLPGLQLALASKLKEQISLRVIDHSHQSLELLQGMLLYVAWYHFYYDPVKQQLATMLQLCVAMLQDLGYCKNVYGASSTITSGDIGIMPTSTRSLAEKRAFLGTYHLAAHFAQARRRPTTLRHTRYMDKCCRHLADCQEYPTDAIITPLIQLSTLISNIQEHFSYDDLEDAEVQGESLLQLSMANFDRELASITNSIPKALLQSNPTLRLNASLISIWISECAIHEPLWKSSTTTSTISMTSARTKTLYRCLTAVQCFLEETIAVPDDTMHHLGFSSWFSWCYASIVADKLVFLSDERERQSGLNETFTAVLNIVADKTLFHEPGPFVLPSEVMPSTWNPLFVAKEGNLLSSFLRMYKKLRFRLPEDADLQYLDHCKVSPLCRLAYFQRNLLVSFTNRLKEHITESDTPYTTNAPTPEPNAVVLRDNWAAQQPFTAKQTYDRSRIPILESLNFNSINFETIAPPDGSMPADRTFEEWLWDTGMNDLSLPLP